MAQGNVADREVRSLLQAEESLAALNACLQAPSDGQESAAAAYFGLVFDVLTSFRVTDINAALDDLSAADINSLRDAIPPAFGRAPAGTAASAIMVQWQMKMIGKIARGGQV